MLDLVGSFQMPWDVTFREDVGVVSTVYEGVMTPKELEDAFRATVSMGQQRNSDLYLADCSRLEGGHSFTDLYKLVDTLKAWGVGDSMKEAVVVGPQKASSTRGEFWETACQNRGFLVRLFENSEAALQWLTECAGAQDRQRTGRT